MTRQKIGTKKDFETVRMKGVEAGGKEILVVRTGENFTAIGNRCTHMGCRLISGTLDGEVVQCPCHGSRFSVLTGEVVRGPARQPEAVYPVTVENEDLFVDI